MKTIKIQWMTGSGFVLGLFAWVATGCMQPTHPQGVVDAAPRAKVATHAKDVPLESNIVRVNKFFSSDPWLSFESDGTSQVDGVRFSLYLEGPGSAKGAFGTGRIIVTMYRLDHDATGRETAAQLYEWDLPPDKAYPWRAKEATALGWGYGMRLQWGKGIDITGRQIAFVVKYVREDGKVITSSRQVMKGPGGANGYMLTQSATSQNDAPAQPADARPNPPRTRRAKKPATVTPQQ